MNKKLIAVALAALPVAAMADVTLYGALKGSVQHDTVSNQASQNRVDDNTSIVGFKGTEDLGNGLKTVWQVENRLYMDGSSGGTLGSRQTFVGLDGGNLGVIRMGYINNTQNDLAAVDQWQYNSNYGTSQTSGANGLGIFTNGGQRLKNALRYDSATFAGFQGSLFYGMGENKTQTAAANSSNKASDVYGLGLNYTYGDVSGHYAYQHESNPAGALGAANGDTGNQAATRHYFEVDYSANNLFVGAAYQQSTGYDWIDGMANDASTDGTKASYNGLNPVAGKLKARQAALSVAYTIGAFTPKATYAKGWNLKQDGNTIDNSGYTQYIVGVDYALSKRTTAGVSYGRINFGKGTFLAQQNQAGSDLTAKTFGLTFAHSF
ncbi:porin [Paludibacterium purpuratum]|uniref:Putative porin n=1 Tax=Paludibacterium purpuratum TaxID=1144873 RepID=A0A4V3DV98_9NEIS|nr:porin [Paludibacterium purpuratum]TDR80149.1 putative porin [Paludibacterium purpuratum]